MAVRYAFASRVAGIALICCAYGPAIAADGACFPRVDAADAQITASYEPDAPEEAYWRFPPPEELLDAGALHAYGDALAEQRCDDADRIVRSALFGVCPRLRGKLLDRFLHDLLNPPDAHFEENDLWVRIMVRHYEPLEYCFTVSELRRMDGLLAKAERQGTHARLESDRQPGRDRVLAARNQHLGSVYRDAADGDYSPAQLLIARYMLDHPDRVASMPETYRPELPLFMLLRAKHLGDMPEDYDALAARATRNLDPATIAAVTEAAQRRNYSDYRRCIEEDIGCGRRPARPSLKNIPD